MVQTSANGLLVPLNLQQSQLSAVKVAQFRYTFQHTHRLITKHVFYINVLNLDKYP